jgi:hypothetical protein
VTENGFRILACLQVLAHRRRRVSREKTHPSRKSISHKDGKVLHLKQSGYPSLGATPRYRVEYLVDTLPVADRQRVGA